MKSIINVYAMLDDELGMVILEVLDVNLELFSDIINSCEGSDISTSTEKFVRINKIFFDSPKAILNLRKYLSIARGFYV